ncbi:hypothetical protein Tco_0347639 [Tanacetum coccineum]
MNEDYCEQNFCYFPNSFGFDQPQPPQDSVDHQRFLQAQEELEEIKRIKDMSIEEMRHEQQLVYYKIKEITNDLGYKRFHGEKIDEEYVKDYEIRIRKLKQDFNEWGNEDAYIPLGDIIARYSTSKAIIPDLPIEEPDNSLNMGDEHLDTTPSIENLVPISSEFEGISDDTSDVPTCDNNRVNVESDLVESLINQSTAQIPPPVIPISIPEPDIPKNLPKTTPIPESDIPKSLPKPNIPYPSRRDDQKSRDKASNQMEKIFQIFQDLRFDISFADALLLMPRFAPTIKSLLMNKEKLLELAKIPLNENCSAMLLKKLPEKLGDPGKFLIPCNFPGIRQDICLIEKLLNNDPFQLPPMDLKQSEVTEAKSSIEEPPELELKDLPSHLEYAFLEENDKLPVIIAKGLKNDEKKYSFKGAQILTKLLKRSLRTEAPNLVGPGLELTIRTQLMQTMTEGLQIHYTITEKEMLAVVKQDQRARGLAPVGSSPTRFDITIRDKKGSETSFGRFGILEYNCPSWNRLLFYFDDDDDEYTVIWRRPKAITPDEPSEEPKDPLIIGEKELSTIPKKDKSSVEDLIPIPSRSKGVSDDIYDHSDAESLLSQDILIMSPKIDFLSEEFIGEFTHILSEMDVDEFDEEEVDCYDHDISSDDDSYENIEYVEASPLNLEYDNLKEGNEDQEEKEFDLEDIFQIQDVILHEKLLNVHRLITNIKSLKNNSTPDHVFKFPSSAPISVTDSGSFFEESDTSLSHSDNSLPKFETFSDHTEETRSGGTTTHANNSLPEYDLFLFEIEPDQGGMTSIIISDNSNDPLLELPEFESFHFDLDLSVPRPPPKPPDVEISLIIETNAPVINDFDELNEDECFDPRGGEINVEVDNSFTFVIWIFLPYLTYPVGSSLLSSARNEDTSFDPVIST